jgi:hypothetical protein
MFRCHEEIVRQEVLQAVAILIKHRNYLLASEFLQNVVFINLQAKTLSHQIQNIHDH